ncbi:MAG: 1-acyl-sn-glycerol-3-phosphate acyltransferase [Litoreibacter sp.]
MFETVELPVWALILIGLLAAITAASHLLFPSVRWFFRRRAERVVAKLNARLTRPIQPFKLARRHDMIQNVLYDPVVIAAVNEHAAKEGIPDNVAFETAERYAREIVPSFSATIYFGFGTRIARWLARSLYRVRLFNLDRAKLDAIDDDATVVFVMNHRSNMDYVLVTYLAARESALSYAVGEWAQVWPLQPLIKMMGGYFIRRRSLTPLYRKVLARYVRLSTAKGVAQAIFPEGRLSRSGALGDPKLGLISYIIDGFDIESSRDVVFVPVGLSYDRVLEDKVLIASREKRGGTFKFRISTVFHYVGRHFWQRVTGRFHRMGYAGVAFGEPVSLREFVSSHKDDRAQKLGEHLMMQVGQIVPVLPVPLMSNVIMKLRPENPQRTDLIEMFATEVAKLRERDVEVCIPKAGVERGAIEALEMLQLRGLIEEIGAVIHLKDDAMAVLEFYAASAFQSEKT